jgi:5'-3' exonuclease
MLALIDGDICIYRVGYTTENDDFAIARWRLDEMLDGILIDTSADEYRVYLSDSLDNNFRKEFYPEYKANRTLPKPKHYEALKEYIIKEWGAIIALEQEADDALGIDQDKTGKTSVICSIDKDLLQIPGRHWNFVRKEHNEVSPDMGLKTFYRQLLVGDTSDNIKGVKGIGPIKAERILLPLKEESALFAATVQAYQTWLSKEWNAIQPETGQSLDEFQLKQMYNIILSTGRALKIRQKDGEIWQFPEEFMKRQPILEGE